jgi:uncharacterized protein (DUF2062 family)
MLTYGGHTATAGTYWNMMNGERIDLVQEGVLPGSVSDRYLRAPAALAVAAGPALGLVFAVFLPFIAIAMALTLLGRAIIEGMVSAATSAAVFGWRPIESYLAGRKMKKLEKEKRTGKR